ncbi:QueT transporter family protein [bacterium]|nr:QueT transporter family protein [bacterium]
MKDIFEMWSNTRMVVLTAICAALYAGLMLPFKIAPIVPGFTEIRPGIAIPLTCSFLFGPAAAWGAAIGNVIGDIWGGMIGPGSFFGFFGNFLMGLIPYKFWRILTGKTEIEIKNARSVLVFILTCITASSACAVIIGWGLDILKLVPLRILANVVAINNSIFSALLGLPLSLALYKRVKQWGLIYSDVMKQKDSVSCAKGFGVILMILASAGGIISVNLGIGNPEFTAFAVLTIIASFFI